MRKSLENMKRIVYETLKDDITDVEYTTDGHLTDDDIRQYLHDRWQLAHPTDLQKQEKAERNEILVEAIQYRIPLRQLSRMTGISYGVIQRTNGKLNGKKGVKSGSTEPSP